MSNNVDGPEVDLTPDVQEPIALGAEDALSISGILGPSADDSLVRIYLDGGFRTFYDIPREAVVHRQRVDARHSPLGVDSTVLRVKAGTRVIVQRSSSRTIEDEFLSGDFTAPGTFSTLKAHRPPQAGSGGYFYPTTRTVFDCTTCSDSC